MKKTTIPDLRSFKGQKKITALTAYDYTMARILNAAKVDMILVGDSLSSVIQGTKNTIGVTLDEMVYHTKCVARACDYSLLAADMPYMTYQESNELALRNAARLMQEGRAECVKVEGGKNIAERIQFMTKFDVPVVGHVGLLPQSFHKLGGHKNQGKKKSVQSANEIIENALAIEEAGVFAIVIECVPEELAKEITTKVSVPTIGIGCGHSCDGQIAVTQDLLGLTESQPSFVTPNQNILKEIIESIHKFSADSELKESISC